MRYEPAPFDSEILGFPCGQITEAYGEPDEPHTLEDLQQDSGASFLHFRTDSRNLSSIRRAEQLEFRMVDVLLQVRRNLSDLPPARPERVSADVGVRGTLEGDLEAIRDITKAGMAATRLHNDNRIDRAVAGLYYVRWMENIILGRTPPEHGVACRTALIGNEVVGYMATAKRGKVGRFMLMTIHGDHKRKGIARLLASDALHECAARGCESMETGVLLRSPVINLYMDLGYRLHHSEVSFHWVRPWFQ